MAKKKLIRIKTLDRFSHIVKNAEQYKGKWDQYFENHNPIVAELGCGKGDYVITLAERYPENNYIGIDIKGPRLWIGARKAEVLKLSNVAFLRIRIESIADYFQRGEIKKVWITFPDPYPKRRREKHRLTSPLFLNIYATVLNPEAPLHFKTDDSDLYAYTLAVLKKHHCTIKKHSKHLYSSPLLDDLTGIRTTYEKRHIDNGKTIKYILFQLKDSRQMGTG